MMFCTFYPSQSPAGPVTVMLYFYQNTGLWWDLPVIESLDLLRHIYRVPEDRYRANLRLFDDLLELGPFLRSAEPD